jgi:hypothetical protein
MSPVAVFSAAEREQQPALKGVGPTVVRRLEQTGHAPLATLAGADPHEIARRIDALFTSSCWRNSPQALRAITAVVDWASHLQEERRT